MKQKLLILIILTSSFISYGQYEVYHPSGENSIEKDENAFATIRGTVIDDETGEALIGVNVVIEGTTTGTVTDIDGNYSLKIKAGTPCVLVYSYISFASQKVDQINVASSEVSVIDVRLKSDEEMLEEVVIQARAMTNTETAIFTIQKKSANLLNGISSQTFSKTGDSDAASAVKRVTGVTLEGGKYIYVRGLGDRYSKSTLNGMEIPGLDPERNTVQMDIFPTNVIDNIIVYKTFTPDLPGDFTGGMVDIKTKDFPNSKYVKFGASLGYNTVTHFKDDFILYNGSKTDAVALGKGSRALQFPKTYEPTKNVPQELFYHTNNLNKEVAAAQTNNFLDQSYSLSAGNQVDRRESLKIGYVVALNYKNSYTFRPDQEQSSLRLINDASLETGYSTFIENERSGRVGINDVLWSAMGTTSFKKNNHKIGLKFLHTQSAQKTANEFVKKDYDENEFVSLITDLDYTQRMISNFLLSGSHSIKENSKISWGNAFTYTAINNPERTSSEFILEGDETLFNSSANLDKVYQDLNEINNHSKVDYELSFNQWASLKSKFKAGASHLYKNRNYETYTVGIGKSNPFSAELSLVENLNDILLEENLLSPTNNEGYLIQNVQVDDENKYTSSMNITSAYAMIELPFHAKIKLIGGLRLEYAQMNYAGNDRRTGDAINAKVLNSLQFLPSANFVFHATDAMNVRLAYSKTLARPSFREKSESILYNPIEGTTFYGNLDLVETNIHNVDARWEYFFGSGEMITLSGFYKKFINPIEIQPLGVGGPDNLTAVNREQADLFGAEIEFKKNLSFIHDKLKNLSIGSNFTYVHSRIALSDEQIEKYELANVEAPKNRTLLGQSPYVINGNISYSHPEIGTQISLNYNMKGKTLAVVGIGGIPNIYVDPFHNLDLKLSQSFGKDKQAQISVSAKNLIGDRNEQHYEFLDEEVGTFSSYSRGRSFSLGLSYKIK